MIDRRKFVGILARSAVMVAVPVHAQPAGKVWRIGFLSAGFAPTRGMSDPSDALWQRLRELGYVEGANLIVDSRFVEGRPERAAALAAELVRLNPDILVTRASSAALAAKKATASIPIVMASSLDPVREGVVASLARPGGNVTGMAFASDSSIIAKRMQLLKEVVPRMSRLAIAPGGAATIEANVIWVKDAEDAAKTLGVQLQVVWVQDPSNWDNEFKAMVEGRADAVYLAESPSHIRHAKHIADLALRNRMPAMFGAREHVEAGGLMSYGLDIPAVFRRAADLVDKVLKGAKPADVPIEQPTKYELVVNAGTAKALGITVPSSLLAWAEVIP